MLIIVWSRFWHGQDNFPFRKKVSDLDIGLPKGAGDEEFLCAVDQAIDRLGGESFDLLFFQAGVDALEMDALGLLNLSREGMRARNERVFAWRRELGLPMLLFYEVGTRTRLTIRWIRLLTCFWEQPRNTNMRYPRLV